MFAADTGAKQIFGIDCADIADAATEIIKENGFEDRIKIIKGKVEEIELPTKKVDIIISEWMGYFLLYESMVDTVLYARDKWLSEDGILMPDHARIHLCAIEDERFRRLKLEFWDDVYGYKMSFIKNNALTEPLVDVVSPNQIISSSDCILELDLYTITVFDLDFETQFSLQFIQKDFCHALVGFFDVTYRHCHKLTGFTTSPNVEYTHWKQTVFYLDKPIRVKEGDLLLGIIKVTKNPHNYRDLIIDITTNTSYGFHQERNYLMR